MKPYYQEDGITIYHGDCRDVLPALPKAGLVLTDPPYGLDMAAKPFRSRFARAGWDSAPATPELLDLVRSKGDVQIIWGGNYYMLPPKQCFLVWDKQQPEDFSSAMCEIAWTSLDQAAKMFRCWALSYERFHPTQKPEALMRWCLKFAEGDVLDPFMGVGTTLRAAKDLGRRAIGIEIEEKYCEIAAKRLSQQVLAFGD